MGLLRHIGIFVLAILFFITVFFGGAFLTFSMSLEYDNFKVNAKDLPQTIAEDLNAIGIINENYAQMQEYCINKETNYKFSQGNLTLNTPCSVVRLGPEKIIENSSDQFLEDVYYKEYNCKLLNCLDQNLGYYAFTSEKSQIYFNKLYKYSLLIAILLFLVLFLLSRPHNSGLVVSGLLLMGASLIYKKLNFLVSLIPSEFVSKYSSIFVSQSENVFLIMILFGAAFFLIGIVFYFFNWSMKLSERINKFAEKLKEKKKQKEQEEKIKEEDEENKELKAQNEKLKNEIKLKAKKSNTKKQVKKKNKNPSKNELKEVLGEK